MSAQELRRDNQGDGFTQVTVALGAARQGVLVVPTDMVDKPGYQEMLDAYVAKHESLVALNDGGVPL